MKRTTNKILSTAAAARITAQWAIKSATEIKEGRNHALITARMFTAFMFEGVVHHLGEKLCSTWDDPRTDRNPPLARCPIIERHKVIRGFLGLDNGGKQYQEIQPIIDRLISFRDYFAHPKAIEETIEDHVESPDEMGIPHIAWEKLIDLKLIQEDYQRMENYCIELVENTADNFEQVLKTDYKVARERYPHLIDLDGEATQLRGFLFLPSMSTWSVKLGE